MAEYLPSLIEEQRLACTIQPDKGEKQENIEQPYSFRQPMNAWDVERHLRQPERQDTCTHRCSEPVGCELANYLDRTAH
jgi:hypothetical protein